MGKAAVPNNEVERLAALARYDILDTEREPAFDDVTALIAQICQTPIAVVNLIADGRQWFKSEVGLGVRETPLGASLCAHAILQQDLFVVPDTTLDPRFADNPLVTGTPKLRFYAGALLRSHDGFPLGTLCVLDVEPRGLSAQQIAALTTLSRHVMNLFELRQSMRRQQELTQHVERALEAHQRVLACVAHDLRNPLAAIVMAAEVLASRSHDPAILDVGSRIGRAANAAKRLADDLVDHEGIVRGGLALRRSIIPLSPVLAETIDRSRGAATAAGVALIARIAEPLGVVLGDADRLTQVFGNLVSNALAHTQRGGSVTLTAERRGQAIEVCVTDTGSGIADDVAPRIFEPFARGPETSSKGVGLGLSIVKTLVDAHEGKVSFETSVGIGTTFRVALPSAPPRPADLETT